VRGRVEYVADLAHAQGLEHVEIRGRSRLKIGGYLAVLLRHGRPMASFVVSSEQARKIQKRQGRLSITTRMIDLARTEESPYGRDRSKVSRVRSEGDTLVVRESIGSWIMARNPRGHFVVAHHNPHTKRWDSLEWFKTASEAHEALHLRRAHEGEDSSRQPTRPRRRRSRR